MICGECVHFNPPSSSCAPLGRRDPDGEACDGPGRWAFPMDQLRAALYGTKAAKPKRAPKPETLQGDLFD